MKMAKPSKADIDAAGNLMVLLDQIDRGDFPCTGNVNNVSEFFDEDNVEHLRAFYLAVKGTLEAAPGYQGRVIAGMCYVIMYEKNEIIDPASDVLDLHPRLAAALQVYEAQQSAAARDVLAERRRQVEQEGWTPEHDDQYRDRELAMAAASYAQACRLDTARKPPFWPWSLEWWKPRGLRRNLVKAGALILAEIERIDRAAAQATSIVCDLPQPGWYCTRMRGHVGPCGAHPADVEHDHSKGGHHD